MSKSIPESVLIDTMGCVEDVATSIVLATKDQNGPAYEAWARNVEIRSDRGELALIAISLLSRVLKGTGKDQEARSEAAYKAVIDLLEQEFDVPLNDVFQPQTTGSLFDQNGECALYTYSSEQVMEALEALRQVKRVINRDMKSLVFCLPSRTRKNRTKAAKGCDASKKKRSRQSDHKSRKEK